VRVLIDTSYAARGPSGTGVYLERLVAALREEGEVVVLEAGQRRRLRPGRAGRRRNPLRSAANAMLDLAWLHVGLPRAARAAAADVVHHPLPAYSRRLGAPQAVTVHDVSFERLPERFDPVWRRLASRAHRVAVREADAVICVSRATAEDAAEILGAPRERIVVAPHGPGQFEGPEPPRAPDEHFLFVGDAEPRKNLDGLLEAYAAYRRSAAAPLPLVLAGGAAGAAAGPGVRGVGSPAAAELRDLLLSARALVHPALHEGFGLTLLEAMALGTPVLAVRNPGAQEVCGDAALLVEPGGLGQALERLDGDPGLRANLAELGRERARAFSWVASARMHERAYTLAARPP
jgi:glycosyltransferase involved in cell wall biosynthesis